jgi:molybdopterin molybdotransferase
MATGDELVMPGETPGPDQIIASNSLALKALLEAEGAQVRLLPIARDTPHALEAGFHLAAGADLLVTTGGASVGDHDLVGPVAESLGMALSFYKIAMRPGKPLMVGRVLGMPLFGLPGNPVSSLVCAHIFLRPALRVLQGLPGAALPRISIPLGFALDANGPREHYMRARIEAGALYPATRQDSALMSVLAQAQALAIRPVGDPARKAGDMLEAILL